MAERTSSENQKSDEIQDQTEQDSNAGRLDQGVVIATKNVVKSTMQGVGDMFDVVEKSKDIQKENHTNATSSGLSTEDSKENIQSCEGSDNGQKIIKKDIPLTYKPSERHGEKLASKLASNENLPAVKSKNDTTAQSHTVHKQSENDLLKHVVTIPVQKMDEGDDLGIYDDPGESGDDLSDSESTEEEVTLPEPLKPKIPPSILRNSGIEPQSDFVQQREGTRYSDNSVMFRGESESNDEVVSRVTWSAVNNHYMASFDQMRHLSGTRGKANTPASHYTDFSSDSRNTSRVPSESREAMYRRAMTLITARCTSVSQGVDTPYGTARTTPFGVQVPQYFYIKQDRPLPMPPLKAWQGYNGNVYFEPIQISSVRDFPEKPSNPYETRSNELRMLMSQQKDRPESNVTRSISRNTGKTNNTMKSNQTGTKQMVLLDKRVVLNRYNDSINDDLHWIEGTENTGSLAVRPKSERKPERPKSIQKPKTARPTYNREKICKGSVVHKMNAMNKQNSQPTFKISGGKYSTPTTTSPLLRTQTQYSLSNQRLTTNSPDLFSQQLPPLEQLRSAVRHMDTLNKERNTGFGRVGPVSYTEEIKPFIKYSNEAKRQTNYV